MRWLLTAAAAIVAAGCVTSRSPVAQPEASDVGGEALASYVGDGGVGTGGLSKDVIANVLRGHQGEVRSCYLDVLQSKPQLAGGVRVHWIISPDGTVVSADVISDTVGEARLNSCIVECVKSWKFPQPIGGGRVEVTFPWTFKLR